MSAMVFGMASLWYCRELRAMATATALTTIPGPVAKLKRVGREFSVLSLHQLSVVRFEQLRNSEFVICKLLINDAG
jgi:hypothetical protein